MKKIQIDHEYEHNIFSSWNEDTSLYIVVYADFPFTKGLITKNQWNNFYGETMCNVGDLVTAYGLFQQPHYLIGKTSHYKLVIKFSNGLYCIYGDDTKYKEIGISLPDELFTM